MKFLAASLIVLSTCGCFTTKVYTPSGASYFENTEYSPLAYRSAKCSNITLTNGKGCYECYYTVEQSEVPFITCNSKSGYIIWR